MAKTDFKIYVGTFRSTVQRYHTFEVVADNDEEAVQKAKDLYTNSVNLAGYIAGATPSEGWPSDPMIMDLIESGTTEPHYACRNLSIGGDDSLKPPQEQNINTVMTDLLRAQECLVIALDKSTAMIRSLMSDYSVSMKQEQKLQYLAGLQVIADKIDESKLLYPTGVTEKVKLNG